MSDFKEQTAVITPKGNMSIAMIQIEEELRRNLRRIHVV